VRPIHIADFTSSTQRVHFGLITSAKEVTFLPDFVCFSVC